MNCFILLLEVSTAVSFMLGLMHWFYLTTNENATLTKEGSFSKEAKLFIFKLWKFLQRLQQLIKKWKLFSTHAEIFPRGWRWQWKASDANCGSDMFCIFFPFASLSSSDFLLLENQMQKLENISKSTTTASSYSITIKIMQICESTFLLLRCFSMHEWLSQRTEKQT